MFYTYILYIQYVCHMVSYSKYDYHMLTETFYNIYVSAKKYVGNIYSRLQKAQYCIAFLSRSGPIGI